MRIMAIIFFFIFYSNHFTKDKDSLLTPLFDKSNNYVVLIQGGPFKKYFYDNGKFLYAEDIVIKSFYLSQFEITAKDWKTYCHEMDFIMPFNDWNDNRVWDDNWPIMNISWNEANAFCEWLSKKIKKKVRLPKEEEWEYAASYAILNKQFYWGPRFDLNQKLENIADIAFHKFILNKFGENEGMNWGYINSYDDRFPTLAPVGSFPANEFGIYDLAGNVPEFVKDDFNNKLKVVKGASFISSKEEDFKINNRRGAVKDPPCYGVGFRIVIEK